MTIIQMRYFQTTCLNNNISKAASFYHVSQPAISNAIHELESEFGVRLFKRNNNRLIITEEGKFLLKNVNNILSKIDELEVLMKDKGEKQKSITVGVPPIIGTFIFPKLVNGFLKHYPDVQFSITETGSLKVLNLVETNQVDLGIITYDAEMEKKFQYIGLVDTEFVFAVNKNHPFAKKRSIKFTELDKQQVILYAIGSYQNSFITKKIDEAGINPIVFLHSSQLATILEFLKYPNIGAFLHREIVDANPNLVGIPFEEPIKVKVGLVYNKLGSLLTLPQRFVTYCKDEYSLKNKRVK